MQVSSTTHRRRPRAHKSFRIRNIATFVLAAASLVTVCGIEFPLSSARLQAADEWMALPDTVPSEPSSITASATLTESPTSTSKVSPVPEVSQPDLPGPWLRDLESSEVRVRRRALERLDQELEAPSIDVHQVVARLSQLDPDPLVRGRAELLMITWGPITHAAPSKTPSLANLDRSARVLRPVDNSSGLVELSATVAPQSVSQDTSPFNADHQNSDLEFEAFEPSGSATLAMYRDEDSGLIPDSDDTGVALVMAEQPDVLYRPLEQPFAPETETELQPDFSSMVYNLRDAPSGYSGRSSVLPSEGQTSGHFVPIEDRWRIGLPYWDRYGKGHPPGDDYQYVEGHWWDPYNQNVLKGDYPIMGQHTFLNITAQTNMLNELRNVPTATTPFESTVDPYQAEFFGNSQQYFYTQNFKLSFDLFHGNTAFKPADWRIKVSQVFNLNYLDVNELGVVGPDVRAGTTRARQDYALEEWFIERKLFDIGPDYDFMSVRTGSQFFSSDFRGFIFTDINRGVRFFGTRNANRDQFNVAAFDMLEKETNSQLNSPHDREQTVVIANYYRQDFLFPGYTASTSFHYNNDGPSFEFDHNDFLARPDPTGSFREHRVEAYYLGFAGDGHMGRINVSNAFYWVLGRDSFNPLAGREQTINAQMAALELSYDRDWVRFRTSFFWSSGDDNVFDKEARGFDTIIDNPVFAGGGFSYWQRQNIRLFGVGLTQRESFVPDLRSSKTQGQANFVNPGLFLYNVGLDADITPKVKLINNANFLWFHKTEVLERFVFQDHINHNIGIDLSSGLEYRPFLNDNVLIEGGVAVFLPHSGFKDLFGKTDPFTTNNASDVGSELLYQAFMDLVLTF